MIKPQKYRFFSVMMQCTYIIFFVMSPLIHHHHSSSNVSHGESEIIYSAVTDNLECDEKFCDEKEIHFDSENHHSHIHDLCISNNVLNTITIQPFLKIEKTHLYSFITENENPAEFIISQNSFSLVGKWKKYLNSASNISPPLI